MRRRSIRALGQLGAATLMIALIIIPLMASGQQAEMKSGEKAKTEVDSKPSRGRLPAYYTNVVDDQQREKIYSIQSDYKAKIDDLKKQLLQVVRERDEKIAAVLSPEQLKKVEEAREAAKKARASAKKKVPKPAQK